MPPPAPDWEIARLFQDLRRTVRLPLDDVARRLGTTPDLIAALEAGHLHLLGPWDTAQRVIVAYTAQVGIDPGPVLARIHLQLIRQAASLRPAVRQPANALVPVQPRGADRDADEPTPARSRASSWRARAAGIVRLSGPIAKGRKPPLAIVLAVGVPLAALTLVGGTHMLAAAGGSLPRPVARLFGHAQELVTLRLAPKREGLRWIEVDDPRARRSDKLQSGRR